MLQLLKRAYAEPPLGKLRFAAPVSPSTDRTSIRTGSARKTCPNAIAPWFGLNLFNASALPPNPSEGEDCLYSLVQRQACNDDVEEHRPRKQVVSIDDQCDVVSASGYKQRDCVIQQNGGGACGQLRSLRHECSTACGTMSV